jgi:bacteriorhodopsin
MLSFPLQLLALYFVLQVGSRKDCCLVAKLVGVPIAMLSLGYMMDANILTGWWVLVAIASLWGFILYILWLGRGNRAMLSMVNLSGRSAYRCLRWIVTVGWLAYPLSYYLGSTQTLDIEWVNIMLNELDCVNKLGFVIIIWYAAYKDSGLLNAE